MYEAASLGLDSVVIALVRKGEGPNEEVEGGLPLLHFVIGAGHGHLATTLLELGADVNLTDAVRGCTPLMTAVLENDVATARVLVEVQDAVRREMDIDGDLLRNVVRTPLYYIL